MTEKSNQHPLPALITGEDGHTVWSERVWPIETRGGMAISPRIDCSSLRLRTSEPGYTADWHVAGDPTLIVVQAGQLRLSLRDGSERTFSAGEAFIAADNVPEEQVFDDTLHGHRAEVVGHETLHAVHIKLTAPLG